MTVFHAAERYRAERQPVVVVAGTQLRLRLLARLGRQGHGAARRPRGDRRKLRAHPPLQPRRHGRRCRCSSRRHDAPHTLGLTGSETFDLPGFAAGFAPGMRVRARFTAPRRRTSETELLTCRVDTRREADWVRHGGILPYVLNEMAAAAATPAAPS